MVTDDQQGQVRHENGRRIHRVQHRKSKIEISNKHKSGGKESKEILKIK